MDYPREHFSEPERRLLEPHFTNLDRPVFCVVDLPEVVKGALFARYSRYPGTLRRLFLDEFTENTDPSAGQPADGMYSVDIDRADRLYERVFIEYGDDSVAQVGGAHLACEWVSNVLTKVLQRGRLAAYLEQSTRYIAYDRPLPSGRYRYYYDDERLGPRYAEAMEQLFSTYSQGLDALRVWASERFPRGEEPEQAWRRSIEAKALDGMRGLLPAASLSHVGVYASGQAYEQLVMRLLASPLPEARQFGELALEELQKVIPSFVRRVQMPDRGGAWIGYLRSLGERAAAAAERYGLGDGEASEGPAVRLSRIDGTEEDLLAASLFEASGLPEQEIRAAVSALDAGERGRLLAELVGERGNRRHKPGRGFEAVRYRFEIESDYGAFRDLQRHRMLTCQWQRLGCELGADVPEEVEAAGFGDRYIEGLEMSRCEYERLRGEGLEDEAMYAVSLQYRIRYVLDMNAREAIHLIELRSGREGHPSYRAVALEMLDQIAEAHPGVGAAMTFADRHTGSRLERLQGELRRQRRLQGAGQPQS